MPSRVKLAYVLTGMIVEDRVNESVGAKERWKKMKKEKKKSRSCDRFIPFISIHESNKVMTK